MKLKFSTIGVLSLLLTCSSSQANGCPVFHGKFDCKGTAIDFIGTQMIQFSAPNLYSFQVDDIDGTWTADTQRNPLAAVSHSGLTFARSYLAECEKDSLILEVFEDSQAPNEGYSRRSYLALAQSPTQKQFTVLEQLTRSHDGLDVKGPLQSSTCTLIEEPGTR